MALVPEVFDSSGFVMRSAREPPVGAASTGCSEAIIDDFKRN